MKNVNGLAIFLGIFSCISAHATTPILDPGMPHGVAAGIPQPACIVQVDGCSPSMNHLLAQISNYHNGQTDSEALAGIRTTARQIMANPAPNDDVKFLRALEQWLNEQRARQK